MASSDGFWWLQLLASAISVDILDPPNTSTKSVCFRAFDCKIFGGFLMSRVFIVHILLMHLSLHICSMWVIQRSDRYLNHLTYIYF